MDAQKRIVLKEIGYEIRECCGLCEHSSLGTDGWGECLDHKYKHLKHTGPERRLSINRYGWCPKFKFKEGMANWLLQFKEFMK